MDLNLNPRSNKDGVILDKVLYFSKVHVPRPPCQETWDTWAGGWHANLQAFLTHLWGSLNCQHGPVSPDCGSGETPPTSQHCFSFYRDWRSMLVHLEKIQPDPRSGLFQTKPCSCVLVLVTPAALPWGKGKPVAPSISALGGPEQATGLTQPTILLVSSYSWIKW